MGGQFGGGLRPDPLSNFPVPVYKRHSRFAATSLRGFYLLQKGIFPNGQIKRGSGTQAIDIATETLVTFDTVVKDATADEAGGDAGFSMASLGNERLYARVPGFYLAFAGVPWEIDPQSGAARVRIKKNGSTFIASGLAGESALINRVASAFTPIQMARDDYIEAWAFQEIDVSLNIVTGDGGPYLALTWVGL